MLARDVLRLYLALLIMINAAIVRTVCAGSVSAHAGAAWSLCRAKRSRQQPNQRGKCRERTVCTMVLHLCLIYG